MGGRGVNRVVPAHPGAVLFRGLVRDGVLGNMVWFKA